MGRLKALSLTDRERSDKVLVSGLRGYRFEPHLHHCVVLCLRARLINPCLVLVHPRKTRPDITEKLLTGT